MILQISDLTPLKTNPVYKRVLDLYLDDNVVESVTVLDGIDWLEHFRLFSLRGNQLTDVCIKTLNHYSFLS